MGKYFNKIRNVSQAGKQAGINAGRVVDNFANKQVNRQQGFQKGRIKERNPNNGAYKFEDSEFDDDSEEFDGSFNDGFNDNFGDVAVQPAQKPASFHHFILENKYKDLEKNIRGYKDVYNKEKQEWEVKRKDRHCFTDEESEEILRTVQSHLSTDIKLTFYSKDTFGIRFLAVYNEIEFVFKRIMEYRYGRYGDSKKQGEMKEQAVKIFVDLITRIEANYLMAIAGMENKRTHDAVRSQESLQGEDGGMERGYGRGVRL